MNSSSGYRLASNSIFLSVASIIITVVLSGCGLIQPLKNSASNVPLLTNTQTYQPKYTPFEKFTPSFETTSIVLPKSNLITAITTPNPNPSTIDFRSLFPAAPSGLGSIYNHIVFFSNRTGVYLLYQINLDGSGLTQLSQNTEKNVYDMEPAWSPDGRIAFASTVDTFWQVFVLQPDRPNPTQLTHWPGQSWSLEWSPNGKSLAFVSDVTGDQEIYVISADGGEPINMTNNPEANDFLPQWSPDNQRILFVSDREEGEENLDIYVMNNDGSDVSKLTISKTWDTSPDWSPDGSRIAFISDRDGNFDVYVMDYPNGIETNGGIPKRLTNTVEYEWSPNWSPDGKYIAFASLRDKIAEDYQIYLMNQDGSNQIRLTNDPSDNIIPRWWP